LAASLEHRERWREFGDTLCSVEREIKPAYSEEVDDGEKMRKKTEKAETGKK
jgi:hypothetical protein